MMVRSLATAHVALVQQAIENIMYAACISQCCMYLLLRLVRRTRKFSAQDQDAVIAQLGEIIPVLLEKTTFLQSSVRGASHIISNQ